jgi:isopentenyl-diphosphate delta-isomerase
MMEPKVILVDEQDREIGAEGKLEAHKQGKLHRAFSIFVFNSDGKLLLQKRAKDKYHSGGLWTNTCCSHPQPGKPIDQETREKLFHEMGFECELQHIDSFLYKVEFDNGLTEHEFDHIFVGTHDGDPVPNPDEVSDWEWVDMDDLRKDLKDHPEHYSYWLRMLLPRLELKRFVG